MKSYDKKNLNKDLSVSEILVTAHICKFIIYINIYIKYLILCFPLRD